MALRIEDDQVLSPLNLGIFSKGLYEEKIEVQDILPGDVIVLYLKTKGKVGFGLSEKNIILVYEIKIEKKVIDIVFEKGKDVEEILGKFLKKIIASPGNNIVTHRGNETNNRCKLFSSEIERAVILGRLKLFDEFNHNGEPMYMAQRKKKRNKELDIEI